MTRDQLTAVAIMASAWAIGYGLALAFAWFLDTAPGRRLDAFLADTFGLEIR